MHSSVGLPPDGGIGWMAGWMDVRGVKKWVATRVGSQLPATRWFIHKKIMIESSFEELNRLSDENGNRTACFLYMKNLMTKYCRLKSYITVSLL